jgi:hypothetical protein
LGNVWLPKPEPYLPVDRAVDLSQFGNILLYKRITLPHASAVGDLET